MATDPTSGENPFDLHCGMCRHVTFQDDWARTPYCSYHGHRTDIRVGDVCSHFTERATQGQRGERSNDDWTEGAVEIVESERLTGVTGPFYAVYADDRHRGWYCSNCETVDVAASPMGRLKCNGCGNIHQSNEWDAAYL